MKLSILFSFACILTLGACSNPNKPALQDTIAGKPSIQMQNQQPQQTLPCREIAYQALITSNHFKELTKGLYDAVVKNGGTTYGIDLEGSPNPTQDSAMDYSKTYDFSLHETYTDRNVVTARFTFNPTTKLLYEYDVAQDSLMPIDFDKKLLFKLNSSCK